MPANGGFTSSLIHIPAGYFKNMAVLLNGTIRAHGRYGYGHYAGYAEKD